MNSTGWQRFFQKPKYARHRVGDTQQDTRRRVTVTQMTSATRDDMKDIVITREFDAPPRACGRRGPTPSW